MGSLTTTILLFFSISISVNGVEPPKGETSPASVLAGEKIEARISQLEADPSVDQAIKDELLGYYKSTLEQIKLSDLLAKKAADFLSLASESPEKIAVLKAELSEPLLEEEVDIPPDATLDQLTVMLAETNAELELLKRTQSELASEVTRRKDRKLEMSKLAAAAKLRLEEVAGQLDSELLPENMSPEIAEARRMQLFALRGALVNEIDLYEIERESYEAREELLGLRTDLATRKSSQVEKKLKVLLEMVNERRQQEAAEAARQARIASDIAHPAIKTIAQENARLADIRTSSNGPAAKITVLSQEYVGVDRQLETLEERFENVKRKVEAAGLTRVIGILLQKELGELPRIGKLRRNVKHLQSEISDTQLQLISMDEKLFSLEDLDGLVEELLLSLEVDAESDVEHIKETATELLKTQRDYVNAIIKDYKVYFAALYNVYETQNELIETTIEFDKYLDENILWFRSSSPLNPAHFARFHEFFLWFFSVKNWGDTCRVLLEDFLSYYILWSAVGVFFTATLLLIKRKARFAIKSISEQSSRVTISSFSYVLKTLVATIVLSGLWPLILWFIAWRLAISADNELFPKALAGGLAGLASILITAQFLERICMPDGLGDIHFKWNARKLQVVTSNIRWLVLIMSPAIFIYSAIESQGNEFWKESLGRFAFIVAMLAVAGWARRILHPESGILSKPGESGAIKATKADYLWYVTGLGVPLSLAVVSALGFHYTARTLSLRFFSSYWLILGIVLFNSMLVRWLFITRWKLAIQARKREEEEVREGVSEETAVPGELSAKEPELKLYDISLQARKLLRVFCGLALIVGLWIIWSNVLPALGILDRIELWSQDTKQTVSIAPESGEGAVTTYKKVVPVTLADLLVAVAAFILTFIAAKNAPGLLEILVLQRLPLDFGVRFAISTISRYLITITGVVIAFSMIGIGWAKVQWLAAAVTVGLGFGLQEIFANFVSGLIILFERPMRVGDTVTVGDVSGTVTRIRSRATTITTWQRKELIVPNKEFITGRLVNWSLSDRILRVDLPVGIAYGSDTQLAHSLLLKVGNEHSLVLDDPKPLVLFTRFGESSLDFELRVYISGIESYLKVKHDLHMIVDREFRKANIEIAFPQRDLHLKSSSIGVPFNIVSSEDKSAE